MGGIWALFTRSLRMDARDWWAHGLRCATLLLGYLALYNAHEQSVYFGAPGLRFFQLVVMMNGWLILVAGVGFFSSTITEEKEENTLGLMLMTGLSPLGLLLGKAGGRLVQGTLLILMQIPLALLAITLGGITLAQVYASVAVLVTLLFFVGNVALLCSVLCRTTRESSFAVIALAILYGAAVWIVEMLLWQLTRAGINPAWMQTVCDAHCFRRIWSLFDSTGQPVLIGPCELVFLFGGLICFGLSWACFGWAVRQPDTAPIARFWWMARNPRMRLISPGRVWPIAMAWKELFFTIGGWQFLVLKACGYALVLCLIAVSTGLTAPHGFEWRFVQEIAVVCYSLAMAFEGSLLASRVFSDEIRQQTWSTLCLTPLSIVEIMQLKWAAVLVGLVPVAVFDLAVIMTSESGLRNFFNILDDIMFWGIVAMFVACAHFAAVFSLYVRWGAVPLGGAVVWMSFAMMMFLSRPGMGEKDAGAIAVIASFFACLVCHGWLYARMEQLASQ